MTFCIVNNFYTIINIDDRIYTLVTIAGEENFKQIVKYRLKFNFR